MEREEFYRDVVSHIEHEYLGGIHQANQRSDHGGTRNHEQDSTERFRETGENFIRRGSADGRPENPHGREVAVRLDQFRERRERHLERNDFGQAVPKHLRSKDKTNKEPEPFVQRYIVVALAIEKRPDAYGGNREDQQAKGQHPVEGFVAAAAAHVNQRGRHMKHMRGRPKYDLPHRPERGQVWNFDFGDRKEAREHLCSEAEQPEVGKAEPEGNARAQTPAAQVRLGLKLLRLGLAAHSRDVWEMN